MTPERREQINGLLRNTGTGYTWVRSAWSAIEELLAEVDRLKKLNRTLTDTIANLMAQGTRERHDAEADHTRQAEAVLGVANERNEAWRAIDALEARLEKAAKRVAELEGNLKLAQRIIEVAEDGCSCMAVFAAQSISRNEEAAAPAESDGAR